MERTNLAKTLQARTDRYQRLQNFVENPSAASPVQNSEGQDISKYQAPNELKLLHEEIQDLKMVQKRIRDDPNKKISIRDLDAALKSLKMVCTKKELEYMIWEVRTPR